VIPVTAAWGVSEDGKHALVVLDDVAYVGYVRHGEVRGLRWECSAAHLATYTEVYRPRFPNTQEGT
jgi:hypothetical protein